MKLILTLFCCLSLVVARAQTPASDKIPTRNGSVTVQPVLHGSLILQWNNKSIWVDPYGGADLYKSFAAPDLILITDIHQDHLDLKTLEAINTSKARIVAPQAVADQLPAGLKSKVTVLKNGAMTTQLGIPITAIPMYNLPDTTDARHPKGRGNGYILTIGNKNFYISGDTEGIKEMRSLENIDVAFVCMNLPYTMDVDQAADAVLDFKPAIVYPYHYRGTNGLSDVAAFKQKIEAGKKNIDVRLRKWYPEK